jgi:hypothetical protein
VISAVLAMLGGSVATAGVLEVLRRWPGTWPALAVSVVASALLGALSAIGPHSRGVWAFVGAGLLGTAASLTFVIGDATPLPTGPSAGLSFLLRTMRVIVAKAFLCAAFAAAGYICGELGVIFYTKL